MKHLGVTKESSRRVPVFVVFDLDRTLIDTNVFVELIWGVLPSLGMAQHDIETLQNDELSRRGQQFDLINEIVERLGMLAGRSEFATRVTEEARSWPVVYGDVPGLLKDLKRLEVPAAIMTYGSELSQQMKLQILLGSLEDKGLMPPTLVIQHQEKAKWVAQNATIAEGGGRIVPRELSAGKHIIADRIVIVDDKQPNLDTDADDIEGVLIDNQSSSGTQGIRIGELSVTGLLTERPS